MLFAPQWEAKHDSPDLYRIVSYFLAETFKTSYSLRGLIYLDLSVRDHSTFVCSALP